MRRQVARGQRTRQVAHAATSGQVDPFDQARRTRLVERLTRRTWMQHGLLGLTGMVLSNWTRPASAAAQPAQTLSTREARELAQQLIPFDQLQEPTQDRLWNVVSRTSIHRHLPDQVIGCDPDLYLFFVRNPEIVVSMWQMMGITNMTLKRVQDYIYDATDGMGTQARIELIYGTPDKHVFLADGAYEGTLIKKKTPGRCVLVLRTEYARDRQQRPRLENQLDAFIQLDNLGSEIVAKTLQPVIGKTADHNFSETMTFVGRLSQAIEKNSSGVERLASKLKGVEQQVKRQFIEIATAANHREVLRSGREETAPVENVTTP